MNEVTKSMGAMPDLGASLRFHPPRSRACPSSWAAFVRERQARHKTMVHLFLASTFALGLSVCGIIGGN